MKDLVILRSLMIFVMASLMSGCTLPFFSGNGAFDRHAEEVFHLQNQMTSEVMMRESDEALMQAEQQMRQACADLNEYASRDIDGLIIGPFLVSMTLPMRW